MSDALPDVIDVGEVAGPLTPDEARRLTDEARNIVTDVASRLRDLKRGAAWKALGYPSWKDYAKAEFNYQVSYADKLVAFADVRDAITAGTAVPATENLTEGVVRPLARMLPSAEDDPEAMAQATEKIREAWGAVQQHAVAEGEGDEPRPITAQFVGQVVSREFPEYATGRASSATPSLHVMVGRVGDALNDAMARANRVETNMNGKQLPKQAGTQARTYAANARALADQLDALAGEAEDA